MQIRFGPIGGLKLLATRHPGSAIVAGGIALELWSLMSIGISNRLPPQNRYGLLLIELAVIAMMAAVGLVIVGACWQLVAYTKRRFVNPPAPNPDTQSESN
jgi:hypothetical protein